MTDNEVLIKTMRKLIKLKYAMKDEGITSDIKDKHSMLLLNVCDITNDIWEHINEIEMSVNRTIDRAHPWSTGIMQVDSFGARFCKNSASLRWCGETAIITVSKTVVLGSNPSIFARL